MNKPAQTCEICKNEFNKSERCPISLTQCGHTICNSCYNNDKKNCPNCKAEITYTAPNLSKLNISIAKEDPYTFMLKFLVLGDVYVGKTSVLSAYVDDKYQLSIASLGTTSFDMMSKKMTIKDKSVYIKLFDTAGQERFRAVNTQICRDVHAVFFVYDITKEKDF